MLLLRGINLGSRNRIAMPQLRSLLSAGGFEDVETYLQSGNVVLSSELAPVALEATCEELIQARLGFEVPVIARSAHEIAAVAAHDPLRDVANNPKRYQVSFLRAELPAARVRELAQLARGEERLVARGRELYAWHPDGVARSKLWTRLASTGLGVVATARNWTTVKALAEIAGTR